MKKLINFSNKVLEELIFLQGVLQSMDMFFVYLIIFKKGLVETGNAIEWTQEMFSY